MGCGPLTVTVVNEGLEGSATTKCNNPVGHCYCEWATPNIYLYIHVIWTVVRDVRN